MKRLATAWRQHPLVLSVFSLTVLLAGLFAIRAVVSLIYWTDPAHRDQIIEGWMTPRYVVESWHLPPEVMTQALGEGPMPGKRRTLDDIAEGQGVSVETLAARIAKAAHAYRAEQP